MRSIFSLFRRRAVIEVPPADDLRVSVAELERRKGDLEAKARALLQQALRSDQPASRDCLMWHAGAANARAEALQATLDGDWKEAALLTLEAERCDRLAGATMTKREAAHA